MSTVSCPICVDELRYILLQVYLGQRAAGGQKVALKVLSAAATAQPARLARCRQPEMQFRILTCFLEPTVSAYGHAHLRENSSSSCCFMPAISWGSTAL